MHSPSLFTPQSAVALLLLGLGTTGTRGQDVADLTVVKERLRQRVLDSARPVDPTTWLETQRSDGSWPDVNYDGKERGRWSPTGHMSRCLALAGTLKRKPEIPVQTQDALKTAVTRGLQHWYAKDYQCPNWWYNVIGIPRILYRILLLMEDDLAAETVTGGFPILTRAKLGMTGQNLVWVAECTIARGCLAGQPSIVREAFSRIEREIRISGKEGIQTDYSFYQHGNQLYSGGYGRGFSIDCPYFAALARETTFAFSPEKIDILAAYLLDGQQWMVRNWLFDYSACGRELVRKGGGSAKSLANACADMALLKHPRQAEIEAFGARLRKRITPDTPGLTGNRHFWRSDFMTHHRPEYYASVRLTSTRLRQTETCNSENLLGLLLSDGVNYLCDTGEEYRGIFAVWDWARLPGITAEMHGKPPRTRSNTGKRSFVGGVSDGAYGATAMDFVRGGLRARKSWFFFDEGYLCLGAGITCPSEHTVETTINQCLKAGPVTVSDTEGEIREIEGQREVDKPRWIHHDSVAYILLSPSPATIQAETVTGSWHTINRTVADTPVTEDVFRASLRHGATPTSADYAYYVRPGTALSAEGTLPPFTQPKILANTAELQAAATEAGTTAAFAFYSKGVCPAPAVGKIRTDTPCLILLRQLEDGTIRLGVSNPENTPATAHVELSARLVGDDATWNAAAGATVVTFALPDGLQAGATVIRDLRREN
jgi:chondroitin AC lyase